MPDFYTFFPVRVRFINLLITLCIIGLSVGSALAQTRYVKPSATGTGDGSSWANASADLQAMITTTSSGSQVWVAAGTYKPNSTGDRQSTYTMKPGVAIYGGFVGNEVLLSQRPAISLTVPPSTTLSGDIYNNTNISVYNIVRNGPGLTNTAILDGFMLAFGLANNSGSQALGGAISNLSSANGGSCSPTIRNCWFMNNIALNGGGAIMNFGLSGGTSSPVIENCRFQNNSVQSGSGGAIHNRGQSYSGNPLNSISSPRILNCLFIGNSCSGGNSSYDGGGAIHNYAYGGTASPIITGSSFQNNSSTIRGGAICTNGSGLPSGENGIARPVITNCSFQGNTAPVDQGPAIANIHLNLTTSTNANATLINCIVFNNNGSAPFANASGATVNLSYSLFETGVDGQSGNTTGAGNIITSTSPFVNTASNVLSNCSAAINAGLTSAANLSSVTTDLAGSPRVADGVVDMGAYESVFSINAGAIAGPPIVPFPIESVNTITSLTAASGTATPLILGWQYSQDNGQFWIAIPNSNTPGIDFPSNLTTDGNPNKTYQFRRVITDVCSRSAITTAVSVKMIKSNGAFVGKVVSGDGITPVAGVTITAVRTTVGLAGSPNSWTYTSITGADGTYNVAQIYYGVPAGTVPTSITAAAFIITPRYTDPSSPTLVHVFSPASQTFTLNETNTPKTFDFTDNTTFGMLGQTRQTCTNCITGFSGQTPWTGNVTCPVDGVIIKTYKNGTQINATQSGYSTTPAPADYGRFAVAVNSPGSYSLTAALAGLSFVPSSQTVSVVSDVYNINFDAPTSQTIIGRISAGCNEAIGSAVLEFNDILKDGSNNPRPSCFRKQVTTNAGGFYTIVLPPRKYKVTVISFTPTGTVASTDFINFINIQTPADSLIRDITSTTAVTTLNLTYQRPPVLTILGLVSPPGCGTAAGYSLMQQANPTTLTVVATQGATGCPVVSGTVLVSTNIQNDTGETATATVVGGSKSFTITPGSPNVIAPYYRTLNVQFSDVFGRSAAAINRNVVVTGVQAGTATFQTVSPQIPLLVLHDPPGDASSSFWSSNTTFENTARFSYSLGSSVKTWFEAKVGVKLLMGLFVLTETSVFGTIGGGLTASSRNVNARETVLTTTTSNGISTGNTANAVGGEGDVFYGTALNMFYAVSTVIAFDPTSCSVGSSQQLIVSNSGRPGTDFFYTADFIKNTSIPNLQFLSTITTDPTAKRGYLNQMKVWQQVLDNNEANKKVAQFVRNKSFGGFLGDITESVTKSVQKSNTIEYGIDINTEVAVALGFEIAGNGFQGGVTANFKAEIGGSETNTSMTAVTTGYTLRDTGGDLLSVDIKTDPIYGTPVFDLLGGSTSCPNEPGTLARDAFQLTAPVTVVRNVAPGNQAQFTLNIGNISQVNTDASRTVWLSLVPGSNPDGALIEINGGPYTGGALPYPVNRLQNVPVTVRIGKSNASDVYAYEGVQFQLTDNCGSNGSGNVLKTIALSAFFQSPCSSVSLVTPEPNWVSTTADNNSLPVLIGGYTLANLTNVTLQYQPQGGSWTDGYTLTAAQLNNSANGTQTNWNTSGLADGNYNLRLRLTCPIGGGAVGTVYSSRANGIIDRTAPSRFGNTQPANSSYVTGSSIGISYSEALACSRISSSNIIVKSLTTGQVIPVSVGCYQNQISVIPAGNLGDYAGSLVSLTLTGVADVYGNTKATPDSWQFVIPSPSMVIVVNPLSIAVVNSPILENSANTMAVVFQRPQSVPNNTLVNFSVAGTAQYGIDYRTAYSNPYVYGASSSTATQPLSATVNGSAGTIVMPANATSVTLLINAINDALFEPDETIIISLLAGGDYQIGSASSVTAVILNDDPLCPGIGNAITTVKNGSWDDPTVWSCGAVPTSTDIVQLNHVVTVAPNYIAQIKTMRYGVGGKLTCQTGARLRLGF